MMTQALRSQPAVYGAIAAWAERATTTRLAVWVTVGAVGGTLALLSAPGWGWVGAMPLLCISCAAAWGLANRAVASATLSPTARLVLRVARGAAQVVGTLAFIIGFYGLLLWALGQPWML